MRPRSILRKEEVSVVRQGGAIVATFRAEPSFLTYILAGESDPALAEKAQAVALKQRKEGHMPP